MTRVWTTGTSTAPSHPTSSASPVQSQSTASAASTPTTRRPSWTAPTGNLELDFWSAELSFFSGLTSFPNNLTLIQKSEKIVLDLSGNKIQDLSSAVSRYYSNQDEAKLFQKISRLSLSRNQINVFNHSWLPPNLEELYLDNNRISKFQQSDINYFDNLVQQSNNGTRLKLGNNPYSCSCDSNPLYYFVKNRGDRLDQHLIKMKCDADQVNIIQKCIIFTLI